MNSDLIVSCQAGDFDGSQRHWAIVRQHFLDKTFQGLYHANGFDLALLIPYFIVLILLAAYGVHATFWSIFITSIRTNEPKIPRIISRNCRELRCNCRFLTNNML